MWPVPPEDSNVFEPKKSKIALAGATAAFVLWNKQVRIPYLSGHTGPTFVLSATSADAGGTLTVYECDVFK